jgi:hypothetical protein
LTTRSGSLGLMPALAFATDAVPDEVPQMSAPQASNAAALSDAQKAAIEDVVRNLLTAKARVAITRIEGYDVTPRRDRNCPTEPIDKIIVALG